MAPAPRCGASRPPFPKAIVGAQRASCKDDFLCPDFRQGILRPWGFSVLVPKNGPVVLIVAAALRRGVYNRKTLDTTKPRRVGQPHPMARVFPWKSARLTWHSACGHFSWARKVLIGQLKGTTSQPRLDNPLFNHFFFFFGFPRTHKNNK